MIGLVTGAGRGLGYELVKLGLEKGNQMIACWLGYPEDNTELLKLKEQYKDQMLILQMDVTKEEEVVSAAIEFSESFNHLDFIVNNAGVLFESKYDTTDVIRDIDIKIFRKTLEVNTVGPAIVLKEFIPLIYKSHDPCIINITSEAGHLEPGGHNYLAYSVSKHGANMYTQKIRNYLAHTEGKEHIRIFMVHPGRMQTVMGAENAQIEPNESAQGIYKLIDKTINPKLDIPFVNYKGEQMPY
ncbi:SDR family NAD(P)-dependent oxidoreductase [Anaerocolumna sp. MB42-C2]|uniref:SDR family NAD(P)-dependent oxidoreductase n=1 Tax=Anaerocolumna sp. MB42-C2 TaxID=3070997 RepID=UPI0027DFFA11|nr:SDR family NAD(P)-dependent oxidoreductase [Anaerocolumna sp. MB42-C2]WMJ87256.1 SDR family NAD(P)-dependent oxidoreductase [Anaerocolumna sp. MB42-C2]